MDFDAIAAEISPEQLGVVLGIEKVGSRYRCPFPETHRNSDRNPSFSLFRAAGRTIAKCHSCGYVASPVQLAARIWGLPDHEAASELVRQTGVDLGLNMRAERDKAGREAIPDVNGLRDSLTESDRAELREKHCLTDAVIAHYHLGKEGERLTIPVRDTSEEVVNVRKWLRPEERGKDKPKILNLKGRGQTRLFPVDQLAHDPLLLCEGELDALAAISAGFHAITATGGARTWTDSLSRQFKEKHVFILMDNDRPGREGADKRAESLARFGVKVAVAIWPDDRAEGWDITDELLKYGPESLARIVGDAKTYRPPAPPGLVRLSDVVPQEVSFLWRPYLPLGKLCALIGDPGVGKSWLSLSLACCVSVGGRFPGEAVETEAADVLLLSSEDGIRDTVSVRVHRLGGDPDRIHAVNALKHPVWLGDTGAADLRAYLKHVRPRLVVLDPLQAFLGPEVDMHRANETRPVMASLMGLAEEFDCAILVVGHMTKQDGGKAIYRMLGSIDIVGTCRSVLLAGFTSDRRRALIHAKSNLATVGPSWEFDLRSDGFHWLRESDVTESDLMNATRPNKKQIAEDFLSAQLAGGPMPQKEIESAAKERGITPRTLKRAKKEVGVNTRKDGFDGGWLWELAEEGQRNQ